MYPDKIDRIGPTLSVGPILSIFTASAAGLEAFESSDLMCRACFQSYSVNIG